MEATMNSQNNYNNYNNMYNQQNYNTYPYNSQSYNTIPPYDPAHAPNSQYGYSNTYSYGHSNFQGVQDHTRKKSSSNFSYFIIIFLVSIIMFISILAIVLVQLSNEDNSEKIAEIVPMLITGFFAVLGLTLTLVGVFKKKGMKSRCTVRVSAVCVDVDSHVNYDMDGPDVRVYCPIYQYYYNGQVHRVSNNVYTNFCVTQQGSRVELLINPYKPEEFLEPKSSRNSSFVLLFIGIIFMIIGTVGMIIFSAVQF